jgi:hypothetical protein
MHDLFEYMIPRWASGSARKWPLSWEGVYLNFWSQLKRELQSFECHIERNVVEPGSLQKHWKLLGFGNVLNLWTNNSWTLSTTPCRFAKPTRRWKANPLNRKHLKRKTWFPSGGLETRIRQGGVRGSMPQAWRVHGHQYRVWSLKSDVWSLSQQKRRSWVAPPWGFVCAAIYQRIESSLFLLSTWVSDYVLALFFLLSFHFIYYVI